VERAAALAPGRWAASHALAVCGDWTDRDGVVAAIGSGLAAAHALLEVSESQFATDR
jgi:predicted NAD/FAD-dependent oxidoreductase